MDTPITLSPDGKHMAYIVHETTAGEDQLIVANVDGSEERKHSDLIFDYDLVTWGSPSARAKARQ